MEDVKEMQEQPEAQEAQEAPEAQDSFTMLIHENESLRARIEDLQKQLVCAVKLPHDTAQAKENQPERVEDKYIGLAEMDYRISAHDREA